LDRRFTFDDYKDATVHELLKDYKAFDLYVLGFITEKELDTLENGRL
jgi:putative flippase GtrA